MCQPFVSTQSEMITYLPTWCSNGNPQFLYKVLQCSWSVTRMKWVTRPLAFHLLWILEEWTSEEKDQHIFSIKVASHGNPANTTYVEFHLNRYPWKPIRRQQSHNNSYHIFVYIQLEKEQFLSIKIFHQIRLSWIQQIRISWIIFDIGL